MAYSERDGLIDAFGGSDDLKNRIIRTVGDAEQRFSEDALRILRALRFAATLDFKIEENTARAIFETKELLLRVSAERILSEWKKLVAGVGAYRIIREYHSVISFVIPSLSRLLLPEREKFLAAEEEIRELSLFALSTDDPSSAYAVAMRALKSDNKRREFGSTVLSCVNMPTATREDLNMLLLRCGAECAVGAIKLRVLLGLSSSRDVDALNNIVNSDACYRISDLKINGADLMALGIFGKAIKDTLEAALYKIAKGELKNEREELLRFAASLAQG
jgi:tRNA nucleotidyltransferase (CCA-adding enzyme)